MASSVKNVLDSLTHQVLVESLFGPGCIHLRQLRLQVAIVRVFFSRITFLPLSVVLFLLTLGSFGHL